MNSLIGELLAGEYEVIDALGHGATSVVYKAMRITDSKLFAIKMLHMYLIEKEDTRKRFEQEAKAAMLLSHSNIVKVHALNKTSEGQPFLIMDYVEGQTLSQIANAAPLALPRAWKFFIQIADAMNQAHAHGVIHRSLKPGNIIITRDADTQENAMVTDFGLAKLLPSSGQEIQQLTAKGAVIGSPLYMSPEQCLGREIDARADIYSMGCLMYTCVSGKPALKGENILDTMSKHVSEIPLTFDKACPELKIPEAAQAIIFKCMAKRPEDRYESMDALKQDLLRFQQGKKPKALSTSAVVIPNQPQVEPDIDDDRFLKLALLAILVLLIGLVAYASWKSPQYKDPKEVRLGKVYSEKQRTTHPISALALLKQADELRLMRRDDEARALYREAILKAELKSNEQSPLDNEVLATAHYGLASIYSKLADWSAAEKELRLALYVQALAGVGAAPGKERIELDLSECLMHQGKLRDARQLLETVQKESTDTIIDARAFLMLGDLAKLNKKPEESEKYLLKAIDILHSEQGLARRFYCTVLARYANNVLEQKQFDKCIKMLRTAIDERPLSTGDQYDIDGAIFLTSELSRALACKGDYEQAVKVSQDMMQTVNNNVLPKQRRETYSPNSGILRDSIAAVETLSGTPQEGEKVLEESLSFDGDRLGRIATLARILIQQEKTGEAMSLLSKFKSAAAKQASLNGELHALVALCYLSEGKLDEALKEIDLSANVIRNTNDEGLYFYCLRIKCQILRALKRDDAADLIEMTIGKPNPTTARFDFLMPPYQYKGIGT